MLHLPATVSLTAVFAIMLMVLSVCVSLRRRELNILLGDGDDRILRRRIRVHGNFAENAPFCVLLVLALETMLAAPQPAWVVAMILLAARILHVIGTFNRPLKHLIPVAMIAQHATLVICGGWLLVQVFENLTTGGA